MYYGICQWNLPVSGPEGVYELKELGLDGMELNYGYELINNIERYQRASDETGMMFPTIGMNVFCGESYVAKGSEGFFEQEIRKALECAAGLNVKTLQIPAFVKSDIQTEEELMCAAGNLKRACELAERYGIYIGTENALDEEENMRLFELVDHQLLKLYFDNQNLWRMKGIHCKGVLEKMREQIVEVHAKDSRVFGGRQKWKPLGKGDAEFKTSMKFLKENGFDGWVHLENDYQVSVSADKNFDWRKAVRCDLDTLKKAIY